MRKIYKYVNAVVIVEISDINNLDSIKEPTKHFLKKVIEERLKNGNNNTSRSI